MRADSGSLPFTRSSREYDSGIPRDFIVDKSRGYLVISPRENLVKLIRKYPDIPVVFPRFGLLDKVLSHKKVVLTEYNFNKINKAT